MLRSPIIFLFVAIASGLRAQTIVTFTEDEGPPAGLCDKTQVYFLPTGSDDQKEQTCSVSKEEIAARLNKAVTDMDLDMRRYPVKRHTTVRTLVNCRGELVFVEVNTKHGELGEVVAATFTKLNAIWTAGTLNGRQVDSVRQWPIQVKKKRILLP